jgi:SOS-response transcriptional repressor LexA
MGGTQQMSKMRKLTTLLSVLALAMLSLSSASVSTASSASAVRATSAQASASAVTALPANGVRIVPGSKINLVSSQSRVPISIRNDYDVEVRVFLWAKPVALWLEMPQTTEVTIPASTTINATVPITAIANGEAEVRVYLTSFSGVRIGPTVWLHLQVERDVEPAILITFSAIVVVLGVIGGRRMLARRRGAGS